MILIIGASGYIGQNLFQSFKKDGYDVLGTYAKTPSPDLIYFDLEKSSLADLPRKPDYILICSLAYHSLDDSKKYWERAHHLDVVQTKKILHYCFVNGITPIYFSSDNVFDGVKGNYREDNPRNPITCYGRLKFEIENELFSSGKPFVILRMGKVFGVTPGDATLITTMVDDLVLQKKKINCATDQLITPLFIDDLFPFVKIIIDRKMAGVYHLASLSPLTRYDLAKAIVRSFNLSPTQVSSCEFRTLSLLDRRPNLIDLNVDKYQQIMGKRECKLDDYLTEIKKRL